MCCGGTNRDPPTHDLYGAGKVEGKPEVRAYPSPIVLNVLKEVLRVIPPLLRGELRAARAKDGLWQVVQRVARHLPRHEQRIVPLLVRPSLQIPHAVRPHGHGPQRVRPCEDDVLEARWSAALFIDDHPVAGGAYICLADNGGEIVAWSARGRTLVRQLAVSRHQPALLCHANVVQRL